MVDASDKLIRDAFCYEHFLHFL